MWSNLLSAALLYGLLSTTIVVAQTSTDVLGAGSRQTSQDVALAGTAQTPAATQTSGTGGSGSTTTTTPIGDTSTAGSVKTASSTPSPTPTPGGAPAGAIAGGVVGGVLFLVLVGALVFFLRKRKRAHDPFGSVEKSADETVANYESTSPLPPIAPVAAPASPHPHHNSTTPNEAHALMSHYGDTQPQHMPQEVQPVIMPAKPYDVNSSSREMRGEDDDGVSINNPSPVTTPSPERQQEQQRSVPRLPIYQGGRKDDVGVNTPPPAL